MISFLSKCPQVAYVKPCQYCYNTYSEKYMQWDDKLKIYVGTGCRECGYTGKRRVYKPKRQRKDYQRENSLSTRCSDKLLPIDEAFRDVKSSAIIKIVNMPAKRCNCNSGECSKCLLDMIDELLITDPTWRSCTCGSLVCFTCEHYKSTGKFISQEDYKYEV